MTKEEALEIWLREIGDTEYSYDFAGRKIKRSDFNILNEVGWQIGYLKPIALGGKENDGNRIIVHHRTLEEKGDNYPAFSIDHDQYEVIYDAKSDYYYVEKNLDNED